VLNTNDPPEWLVVPDEINHIKEEDTFVFDVNATDMDVGDILTYEISSIPITDNITIDPETGVITWTAYTKELGDSEFLRVRIKATDGEEYIFYDFDIYVIPNSPPTVSLISPTDYELVSTLGVELKWEGSDEESDPIFYNVYLSSDFNHSNIFDLLKTTPVVQKTDSTSYFVKDFEVDGIYYWTVVPFDRFSSGSCTDDVFVFLVNTPPTITDIPDHTVTIGRTFEYTVKGNDRNREDSNNLIYSLLTAPEGMTMEPSTGLLNWTPTKEQVGSHIVKVQVSDGKDVNTARFNIEVIEEEIQEKDSRPADEDTSLFPILAVVALVIIVLIVLLITVIILKKRKRSITPDVEYIPVQDKNVLFLAGQSAKPGAISPPSVVIDQVAPVPIKQQTQMEPSQPPDKIPSIPTPTKTQAPQLPPAQNETPTNEPVTEPSTQVIDERAIPAPVSEPVPVILPEPEQIESYEIDSIPEFGLESGSEPVQKDAMEYNIETERVVEETDFDSAPANLRTATVVEPTQDSSVVHEGDTNIWRPDVCGKVAENKELLEQLERLVELKAKGALTEVEFDKKKKELLG
jgi:hypothetical protein